MAMTSRSAGAISILLAAACGAKSSAPPREVADSVPGPTTTAPAPSPADALHTSLAAAAERPDALWTLVNAQRGLSIRSPAGETIACAPSDLAGQSIPFAADQPWRCNASLSRCISRDPEEGDTVYYYRGGRLDTIAVTDLTYLDSNEAEIAEVVGVERGPCFVKELGTAEGIRATLLATLAAKPFDHFMGALIDPQRGLLLGDGRDGYHRIACETASFPWGGPPFEIRESWACDASGSRCTTSDPDDGGFAFFFRDGALDAVISYPDRVPVDDGARVKALLAADRGACAFGAELVATAVDAVDPDDDHPPLAHPPQDLWVYTHPTWYTDDAEGMDGPPAKLPARAKTEHLCGAKAAARANELLLEVTATDPECHVAPISCSFRADSDSVGTELRIIPGQDGGPWVIARLGPEEQQPKKIEKAVTKLVAKAAATKPCK
jgi:hypothetical protein